MDTTPTGLLRRSFLLNLMGWKYVMKDTLPSMEAKETNKLIEMPTSRMSESFPKRTKGGKI